MPDRSSKLRERNVVEGMASVGVKYKEILASLEVRFDDLKRHSIPGSQLVEGEFRRCRLLCCLGSNTGTGTRPRSLQKPRTVVPTQDSTLDPRSSRFRAAMSTWPAASILLSLFRRAVAVIPLPAGNQHRRKRGHGNTSSDAVVGVPRRVRTARWQSDGSPVDGPRIAATY